MSVRKRTIRDTEKHRTYREHMKFGVGNSLKLILAGIAGVIHSFLPWWFKFTTAQQITKSFKHIALSGRHTQQIKKIFPDYK